MGLATDSGRHRRRAARINRDVEALAATLSSKWSNGRQLWMIGTTNPPDTPTRARLTTRWFGKWNIANGIGLSTACPRASRARSREPARIVTNRVSTERPLIVPARWNVEGKVIETVTGDVLILCTDRVSHLYAVGPVTHDGQQAFLESHQPIYASDRTAASAIARATVDAGPPHLHPRVQ